MFLWIDFSLFKVNIIIISNLQLGKLRVKSSNKLLKTDGKQQKSQVLSIDKTHSPFKDIK